MTTNHFAFQDLANSRLFPAGYEYNFETILKKKD